MSILADKQIREYCTRPTFVVEHLGKTFFSRWSLEQIEKYNQEQGAPETGPMSRFRIKHRYLTPEEHAAWVPMIENFIDGQVRTRKVPHPDQDASFDKLEDINEKIVSYGLSSYGYDVRLADDFKIFTNINSSIIDPLNMSDKYYAEHKGDFCIIPPNSYILGHTIEVFNMPDDITAICMGKSTYARCGAIVNVTPIEAGFKGQVVIEISNSTPLPLKIYANMGISQFMFFRGSEPCDVSYAKRGGKYQNQRGIQTALV